MKTNSIKFKFLITLIASILAVTIFIGGISIYEVDTYVQRETKGFVEVTEENESFFACVVLIPMRRKKASVKKKSV